MTPINIMALRHSAFYSPLLICISGGFLEKVGLAPHYQPATPDKTVPDSLRNGSAQLAQSAVATSFAALEQGETCDIVHFAKINERDGFFLAGRQADQAFNWEQLVGKQVLVDHFFQPMAMFRYALHKKGIDEKQIAIIDAGSVEQIDQAFRHGQGDYVHQQGPFPQQLEKDGLGHVVASVGEAVGPVAFSSLCATREWLATDMAQAFMHAYREACAYVLQAPASELARQLAGFFPRIDSDVLTHTVQTYQALGCWTPEPAISKDSYDRLIDVFMYSGLISKAHDMALCVVNRPN
ncbi:MAG: ABC transporter substrate-binding protein [Thioalkalispiraceae bacterium]|jgi:NitT/TauT family transport system substrate-binding protein